MIHRGGTIAPDRPETSIPDKEDRRLVLLQLASIFLPWQKHEVALILKGPTRTGKSILTETIIYVIGRTLTSAVSLKAFDDAKSRYIPVLEKSVFNVAGEIDQAVLTSSGPLKQVMSGEATYTDFKYKEARAGNTSAT